MKTHVPLDNFAKMLKNPSHDKSVMVYDGKEGRRKNNVKNRNRKITLLTLSERMDRLEITIDRLANIVESGFKQVNSRIDNLEKDINTRLDYIVSVNNLKDLPKSNK